MENISQSSFYSAICPRTLTFLNPHIEREYQKYREDDIKGDSNMTIHLGIAMGIFVVSFILRIAIENPTLQPSICSSLLVLFSMALVFPMELFMARFKRTKSLRGILSPIFYFITQGLWSRDYYSRAVLYVGFLSGFTMHIVLTMSYSSSWIKSSITFWIATCGMCGILYIGYVKDVSSVLNPLLYTAIASYTISIFFYYAEKRRRSAFFYLYQAMKVGSISVPCSTTLGVNEMEEADRQFAYWTDRI